MKLIYLNAELDATKEHELFKINGFGFRVEIKYNENCWLFKHKQSQVLRNVTEVHHLFEESDGKDIAFESDIHAEGFTRKVVGIDSVTISLEVANSANFEF